MNLINYKMEKKGLSNLVATVLIVLLALAAVALIWGFLKPVFINTGTQIGTGVKCLDVEVQPVKCVNTMLSGQVSSKVTVKTTKGEVEKIYVVVQYSDDQALSNSTDAPDLFATKDVTILRTTSETAETAKVAAVIIDDQGKEQICGEAPTSVECTTEINP